MPEHFFHVAIVDAGDADVNFIAIVVVFSVLVVTADVSTVPSFLIVFDCMQKNRRCVCV